MYVLIPVCNYVINLGSVLDNQGGGGHTHVPAHTGVCVSVLGSSQRAVPQVNIPVFQPYIRFYFFSSK